MEALLKVLRENGIHMFANFDKKTGNLDVKFEKVGEGGLIFAENIIVDVRLIEMNAVMTPESFLKDKAEKFLQQFYEKQKEKMEG